jgi:fused signal recognition particle receptor
MGILKKIRDSFHKRQLVKKIAQKNLDNAFIKQEKFDHGLIRSAQSLDAMINDAASKYYQIDQDFIDHLEELLISYDIGPSATTKIINSIVEELKIQKITDQELIKQIIIDKLLIYYVKGSNVDNQLKLLSEQTNVILIQGVNGVGKTTTIAKIANMLIKQNKTVCLVAGDTFRAGAISQLEIWAQRLNVPIFKPKKEGQDPASVIFEGVKYGSEQKIDVVLCDTSGRLQNKVNLMNELKKINEIIKRFLPDQPVESLLVLDATTGQNGIFQAKEFNEVANITGIVLTKMDSTAKGGIVLSIKDAFNLPIKLIGLGENIDDLVVFDIELFILGLTKDIM